MPSASDSVSALLLFAHPALERSRINRALLEAARGIEGLTIHDLYEAYPDFHVDVAREQALLTDHALILLQHPLLWYSTPTLVKEWEDLVLEHGWAYGHEGTALAGKRLVSVVTTGGPEAAYCVAGANHCTLRQVLIPIEQTARLCGMRYGAPYAVYGAHMMTDAELAAHAEDYRRFLRAAVADRVDWAAAERVELLNRDLDAILATPEGAGRAAIEEADRAR
jgi:glutathione-regulated potassium-efflux system ancillary protein KefG